MDSQASMEELDFFDEICLISLYAGKAVSFTAVVDSNGKLILAKIREVTLVASLASYHIPLGYLTVQNNNSSSYDNLVTHFITLI